jgi:DNA-binding NtrC family response regulator
VLPIRLPALRERGEDIQLLADYFLWRETTEGGKPAKTLSGAARNALKSHDWPGNVRELGNAVSRAVAMSRADILEAADLGFDADDAKGSASTLSASVVAVEERRIDEALSQTNGRKAEAAQLLGISRKTLWEKLKRRESR